MITRSVSEAVANIEAELAAYWSHADGAGTWANARASTMNLVVGCTHADFPSVRDAVEDLAHTRAGRAFIVAVDDALPTEMLDSTVSTVCHKDGETVVCYDRVELRLGEGVVCRAPSALAALALSEVPTIVELLPETHGALIEQLVRVADRVIVDSGRTCVRDIAETLGLASVPFADRAWVRTFTWRDMVARFFDEAPGAEQAIGRVEIERTISPHSDPAALLLGWLASRLGWRLETAARAVDRHGLPIDLVVRTTSTTDGHDDLAAGEMTAVRLVTAVDNRPLFCACERPSARRVVRWSMSGPRSNVHEHALGFRDETWVLGKAIDATEGDRVYREAAMLAAEWARLAEEVR